MHDRSVEGILDGRKTQTRRPVTDVPPGSDTLTPLDCPYGQPGDLLYVREAIWVEHEPVGHPGDNNWCMPDLELGPERVNYDFVTRGSLHHPPETEHDQSVKGPRLYGRQPGYWWLSPPVGWDGHDEDRRKREGEWVFLAWEHYSKVPGSQVPKEYSRLWLAITDIRVERVQDISREDARAEGVELNFNHGVANDHRGAFRKNWDETYDEEGLRWKDNPWVWVVEFERTEPPEGSS
jgi:hypothetical protein